MNEATNQMVKLAADSSPGSGSGSPHDARTFHPATHDSDFPGATAYRILYQLLAGQAGRETLEQISLANRDETRALLHEVMAASADGKMQLEVFAQLAPEIFLGTRPRISVGFPADSPTGASSKLVESVVAWRDSRLLLARSQTLSYAWYLAGEAAVNETLFERCDYLRNLGAAMKNLHRRTVALMRSQLDILNE